MSDTNADKTNRMEAVKKYYLEGDKKALDDLPDKS